MKKFKTKDYSNITINEAMDWINGNCTEEKRKLVKSKAVAYIVSIAIRRYVPTI